MTTPDQPAHSAPDGAGEVCTCGHRADNHAPSVIGCYSCGCRRARGVHGTATECRDCPLRSDEPTRDQGAGYSCCPCCDPSDHAGVLINAHPEPCPHCHDRPFDPSNLEGDRP